MLLPLLLMLAAAAAPAPAPAPAPASVPAPAPAGVQLQEGVLARAVFLLQREACVLVEPDAPSVQAFDFGPSGDVARTKTTVSHCEPHADVSALLHAMAVALSLAARDEKPSSALPDFDAGALDTAAMAITGRHLLLSGTSEVHAYDPIVLRSLFDALYAKPAEPRIGLPLKVLYEATVKDVVVRIAADLALLTAKPAVLAAESKRALKAPGGKDAWRGVLNKLVKSDDDAARIDPRLVGFVLRRHADGTLPVVMEMLRIVIRDYG